MMKPNFISKALLLLGIAVVALGLSQSVFAAAAGVAANTTVSNSATVDYKVNTIDQTQETSNTADFLVDRKVDFTVVTDEAAAVAMTPGSTGNVLTFTVDNTGNDTFDFTLAAVALSGGAARFAGTDNIDATAAVVWVEDGTTAGFQSGEDTQTTTIDDLAAGSNVKVYIVSTFALGLTDGDIASYYLRATALDSTGGALSDDSGSGDTVGAVDNVLATDDGPEPTDGDLDQIDSDYADYEAAAAALSVAKSSSVVSDPVNGTTNPKAIPGAVIEYEITISNGAGAATATNISFSDSLNTEIATNSYLAFNTQYDATAGQGVVVAHPDYSAGADTEYTNADDGTVNSIDVDWDVTGTNVVTVSGITLDAGESASVKFRVTVQ